MQGWSSRMLPHGWQTVSKRGCVPTNGTMPPEHKRRASSRLNSFEGPGLPKQGCYYEATKPFSRSRYLHASTPRLCWFWLHEKRQCHLWSVSAMPCCHDMGYEVPCHTAILYDAIHTVLLKMLFKTCYNALRNAFTNNPKKCTCLSCMRFAALMLSAAGVLR